MIRAFELAARDTVPLAYRPHLIVHRPGPVKSSSGIVLLADAYEPSDPIDTFPPGGGTS